MYCHQCQTQLPDIARFCISCGNGVEDLQNLSKLEQTKPQQRKQGVSATITALVLLLAIITLWAFFSYIDSKNKVAGSSGSSSYQVPLPVPQTHENQIVSDDFALPPGYTKSYNFAVKGQGTVVGRFEAQGGIDDAIQVVITDRDGLTNLRNGNRFQCWYNSGEVTVQNINVSLSPGDYILVFSNRGSLTNRTIKTAVRLNDYY